MSAQLVRHLLKRLLASPKRRKKSGFTLIELLISILISSVIITVLLSFVIDLVSTDRREYARSENQRNMQTALDFMVADLREAVYVYDNLTQTRDPARGIGPLTEYLPDFSSLGTSVVPVLAFWKAERLPYDTSDPTQRLPDNCDGYGPPTPTPSPQRKECDQVLIRRRAYTLVVYLQVKDNTNPRWKGQSRIVRYALRKYRNASSLDKTPGFVDPSEQSGFPNWPNNQAGFSRPTLPPGGAPVLIDFVDDPANPDITISNIPDSTCTSPDPNNFFFATDPANPPYRRVPDLRNASAQNSSSFFTCVKTASGLDAQNNQDVMIFLRGNPVERGITFRKEPLETIRTQAVTRGVIDKQP
jgi:prepilin-type N-terminal cleavage/methylation domain-containing protein